MGVIYLNIIFWLTTFLFFNQVLYKIIVKKDYFNISVYIAIGVHFPFILYLMNWSILIDPNISVMVFYILSCLNIFIVISNILIGGSINNFPFDFSIKRNKRVVFAVNCMYLLIVLLENYIGSGFLLPAIHGVDIHTYSAPILSYFSESLYTMLIINFLYLYKSKDKSFLIWIIILTSIPLIGKSSRMIVLVSLVQLLSFGLFLYFNDKKYKKSKSSFLNSKRKKILVIASLIFVVFFMVFLTEYRWGGYGQVQVSYSNSIGYTGPKIFEDTLAVFYGYFPLSYNNLNLNIVNRSVEHNYIGLYTYKGLFFGLLRLHNIFDLNPYQPDVGKYFKTGSATVLTGFYDFYYDFGVLSFIPILTATIIYYLIKKNVLKNRRSIFSYALYFLWVPLWLFMSFQNVIYDSTLIIRIIILYLLINYFFKIKRTTIEEV